MSGAVSVLIVDDQALVRAGLRALTSQDDTLETWLRSRVGASYDALKANPSRARSVAQVRSRLKVERTNAQ